MLAAYTVDTVLDSVNSSDGVTSLREAIAAANATSGADEINFAPALFSGGPRTILLTQGELAITDSLTITGPGAELLTIDASGSDPTPDVNNGDGSRILNISDRNELSWIDVSVSGVTLTGGDTRANGGALIAHENLRLANVTITDNASQGAGGGAYIRHSGEGDFTLVDSIFSGNSADHGGGAYISKVSEGNVVLTGNSFTNNSVNATSNRGGGLYLHHTAVGNLAVENNIFSGNTSTGTSSQGGGALMQHSGTGDLAIADNQFLANTTHGTSAYGGGLAIKHLGVGTAVVDVNTFAGNSAAGTSASGLGLHAAAGPQAVVVIRGNVVTANATVSGRGFGGIGTANTGGTILIEGNSISGNYGGIIVTGTGSTEVIGNVVRHNTSTGVLVNGSTTRVQQNLIVENVSSHAGGGLILNASNGSSIVVDQNVIVGNQSGYIGGGVYAVSHAGGSIEIHRSTVSGNHVVFTHPSRSHTGGGIYIRNLGGKINIEQSTISGNSADGGGGGLWIDNSAGSVTVRQSTIVNNRADANQDGDAGGGGIFVLRGAVDVDHTIVAHNSDGFGTATDIGIGASAAPTPLIEPRFNIIGSNVGSMLDEAPVGSPDANGNLIGGPVHGAIDPLLEPLADNGGPTLPGGAKMLTHALLPGSPALDAGDPALVAGVGETPEFDQRGAPYSRTIGRIDMGAVEQIPTTLVVDTLVDESDGNYSTGDLSLREAIELANLQPGHNTIRFDPRLGGDIGTIRLRHGELRITDAVDIAGLGHSRLHISAWFSDPTPGSENGDGARVFHIDDNNASAMSPVTISGLRILGGDIAGHGGGIYAAEPLVLSGVMIAGNAATGNGGGVYAAAGLTLEGSTIVENRSAGNGAGVWARGRIEIVHTSLSNNLAMGSGGAMWLRDEVSLVGVNVEWNTARVAGGGLFVGSDSALYPTGARVDSSRFTGGEATSGGGVAWDEWTFLSMVNSVVMANRVVSSVGPGDGAGLYGAGPLVLAYSTVIDNFATPLNSNNLAAGMRIGLAHISHSVVARNGTGSYDIGLLPGGRVTASYSIVGHTQNSGLAESPAGGVDANGNRIGGPTQGAINPGLSSTGVPTATSLTVNAGNPSAGALPPELSEFDVRGVGFGRVIGGRIDIGAYEYQTPANIGALKGDFDASGRTTGLDFLAWQRGFGTRQSATFAQGDAVGDGDVDANDLAVWRVRFGTATPPGAFAGAAVTPVDAVAASGAALFEMSGRRLSDSRSARAARDRAMALFGATTHAARPGRLDPVFDDGIFDSRARGARADADREAIEAVLGGDLGGLAG